MRRLYWQVYLTFIGILVLFGLLLSLAFLVTPSCCRMRVAMGVSQRLKSMCELSPPTARYCRSRIAARVFPTESVSASLSRSSGVRTPRPPAKMASASASRSFSESHTCTEGRCDAYLDRMGGRDSKSNLLRRITRNRALGGGGCRLPAKRESGCGIKGCRRPRPRTDPAERCRHERRRCRAPHPIPRRPLRISA